MMSFSGFRRKYSPAATARIIIINATVFIGSEFIKALRKIKA